MAQNDAQQSTQHDHSSQCNHQFTPHPPQATAQSYAGQGCKHFNNRGIIQKGFYDAENVLKLGFVVGALLKLNFTNTLGYIICLMAIYRQLKRPRWNKDYGRKLFQNEFFHNMIYLFVFFFFPQYMTFIFYFPLVIHFWIGLCEYLNLRQGYLYDKLKKQVDATRSLKEQIMDMKVKIEIYLFPVIIGMIFIGMSTLYMAFFYSNFLRIKYTLSNRLQLQFADVNRRYVEKLKSKSPRPIQFLITKFQQLCGYLVKIK